MESIGLELLVRNHLPLGFAIYSFSYEIQGIRDRCGASEERGFWRGEKKLNGSRGDYLADDEILFLLVVGTASGTCSCTLLPDETAHLSRNKSIPIRCFGFPTK